MRQVYVAEIENKRPPLGRFVANPEDERGDAMKTAELPARKEGLRLPSTMKALVYHGPGKKGWEEKPTPKLQDPTDALVRIEHTTICGTDLHILKGDVPEVTDGRILGHEGVGVVEAVGAAVTSVKRGDRVLVSCISACGLCPSCRKGMFSHCEKGGGWVLGHLIDGTQAEYVRTPFADTSLYKIPEGVDEKTLCMLSDIFPTGYECGVLNGRIEPGDTVAIVGSGPIGLAALLTAQFYSPGEVIMIDYDENRLELARVFGATKTVTSGDADAAQAVKGLTGGKGVDVAIEAVGVPESFELCEAIIAPGGRIANIGVHGKAVTLHLETLWAANISITTRLVDTFTTPRLLKMVQTERLQPEKLVSHRFRMDEILKAYETFSNAAREKALKVLISR
jgi:alcohol dehydrogenase